MAWMLGDEYEYINAEVLGANNQADAAVYPPGMLHQLKPTGMPPHVLQLKIGAPITLLHNSNPAMGWMNGTRLVINKCLVFNVQAKTVTASRSRNIFPLPCIALTCLEDTQQSITFVGR